MTPTIGRVVNYKLTDEDKEKIEKLSDAGSFANKSDILPATIVAVWGDQPTSAVNLKVKVDGDQPDLWITSKSCGDAVGQWSWPVIKKD